MKKALIISSSYYKNFEKNLIKGAVKTLKKKSFKFDIFSVRGSFEIPQLLNILLLKKKYNLVIVLGCIIEGKTNHHKSIAFSISKKLLDLSIKYKIPISNGIVESSNLTIAKDRCDPFKFDRGGEAVLSGISILEALKGNR